MTDILHAAWKQKSSGPPTLGMFPKNKDWGIHEDLAGGGLSFRYNNQGALQRVPHGSPWQILEVDGTNIEYDTIKGLNAIIAEPYADPGNTLATPTNAADGDEGKIFIMGGPSADYPALATGWSTGEAASGPPPVVLPSIPSDNTRGILLEWVKAGGIFIIHGTEDKTWEVPIYGPLKMSGSRLFLDSTDPLSMRSASIHDDGSDNNTGSLSAGINRNPYVKDAPAGSWYTRSTYLDGTYHIDLASFVTSGEYSFAGWFKFDGTTAVTLLGQSAAATNLIQVTTRTNVRVQPAGSALNFTVATIKPGWHHLIVARDGSNNVRVYVDQVQSTTGPLTGVGELTLDAFGNSNGVLSETILSDWRYYNIELTSSNRKYLYAFAANPTYEAPGSEVGWWTMLGSIEDGDEALVWIDKANGLEAYQFTQAARPIYDATNNCFTYDGVSQHWNIDDNDVLSFTGGIPESEMSVVAWVNPTDATSFWVLTKSDATNREWLFGIGSADKTHFGLFDNTSSHSIRAISDVAITQSVWTAIFGTYDGQGVETGIFNYEDNVAVAATKTETGTYVEMENEATKANIGVTGGGTAYANGSIGSIAAFGKVLSVAERNFLATYGAQYWS